MLKIRIDGIEYDAGSASAQEALDRLVKRLSEKVSELDAAVKVSSARADVAEKAADPVALRKAAAFRADLISRARATKLGPKYCADEDVMAATDDDSIIKAVIGQLAPEMDLSGLDHAGLMIALKLVSSMRAPAAPADASADAIDAAGTPGAALDAAAIVRPLPLAVAVVDADTSHAAAHAMRADAWKISLVRKEA